MSKEWKPFHEKPHDRQIVLTARLENGRVKYEVLRYMDLYKAFLPPRTFNKKNAIKITCWQEIEPAPLGKNK